MFELMSEIPFVSLFIKFMVASTVLLGAVWLMEKLHLINTPDLAELAWKLAIAGSFIATLPIANIVSSNFVIENGKTAALIENLNETKPFEDLAPTRAADPTPLTFTVDSTNNAALQEAKRVIEAAQARLGSSDYASENATDPQRTEPNLQTTNAAETDNAPISTPEYDSERTQKNTFWYSAASLRTTDLAALGWVALAALTVGALIFGYRDAVKNLGSRQRVQSESHANRVLRSVCEKADIRHVPYLSRSGAIKSPVCLPRKEICLPDWAFDDMPESEFKSLLAHELGHMVRRDPIMLMALQVLSRIFFFQPLFIIARKRLTDIAELAADEWAAKQADDSRAVANALFTCATKIHETRQIQWGLAMAGNKSILKQRVERLIHAQSVPFKTAGTFTKYALGVGVIGLSLGLPSVEFAGAMTAENSFGHDLEASISTPRAPLSPKTAVAPRSAPAPKAALAPRATASPRPAIVEAPAAPRVMADASVIGGTAVFMAHPHDRVRIRNNSNDNGNITWHEGDKSVSIKWDGDFRISDDDNFIEPEDEDGYLRIRSNDDGEKRSIKFETKDGKRVHTYKVEGKEKELDAAGKKWLKESIRVMIDAGFGAEQRVARILKSKKVKGVLKEIKEFDGNHVKRIYLTELMDQAKLSDKELAQVVDVVAKFDSDFEKRLTLSALLDEEDLNSKLVPKALAVAKGMDSSFEKRLLVTHFVTRVKLDDKTTGLVLDVAETIDSDFELRLLLTATIVNAELSEKNVQRIIDVAAKHIDSNFEKRILLSSLAEEYDRSEVIVSKVLDAAGTVDSNFERRILLSTVISHAKMNEENWLKAIKLASGIDSDFEKSNALQHIRVKAPKNNATIKAALDKAMEGMERSFSARNEFFVFDGDFEVEFTEGYADAMADLAEEMAKLELEQAQIIIELDGESPKVIERALRNQSRIVEEKQREMRHFMLDQKRMAKELARAERQALRQIERELSRVERELETAGKHMRRELSEVVRQLKSSKQALEYTNKHRKKHRTDEKGEKEEPQNKPKTESEGEI